MGLSGWSHDFPQQIQGGGRRRRKDGDLIDIRKNTSISVLDEHTVHLHTISYKHAVRGRVWTTTARRLSVYNIDCQDRSDDYNFRLPAIVSMEG